MRALASWQPRGGCQNTPTPYLTRTCRLSLGSRLCTQPGGRKPLRASCTRAGGSGSFPTGYRQAQAETPDTSCSLEGSKQGVRQDKTVDVSLWPLGYRALACHGVGLRRHGPRSGETWTCPLQASKAVRSTEKVAGRRDARRNQRELAKRGDVSAQPRWTGTHKRPAGTPCASCTPG